ncbi:SitI3 family protein [Kitasatospora sp. NPDC056273]|uniref:SitI3 family protein n=1 Tax=Kitasatospora sp. NPDC056273 TaxID=3345769 RepID=UPI0035E187AB
MGGRVFTPTVSVTFRMDKDTDTSGAQGDMTRPADGLLAQPPVEAVLHLDHEDV